MENRKTIWVFFGLIATGKSTLAEAWAEREGLPVYNSDRIRKELAGISATKRCKESHGSGIYSREYSARVYDALLERVAEEAARGRGVVLDASYQYKVDRGMLIDLAMRLDRRIVFVYCICSQDVVKNRLEERSRDPEAVSDGRWGIYLIQKERFETPDELDDGMLVTLDTVRPVVELLDLLEIELRNKFNV